MIKVKKTARLFRLVWNNYSSIMMLIMKLLSLKASHQPLILQPNYR